MLCLYSIIFIFINFLLFSKDFISKSYSSVVKFNLEDLVWTEELLSLLEQMLLGLLNGILSLLDNGKDPEDPNPEGDDPEDPEGEDPQDPEPGGEDPEDPNPDKKDSEEENPKKKSDKGKGRAITPESLPGEPSVPAKPSVPEEEDPDSLFEKDSRKAQELSLQEDKKGKEEKGIGESSKQGAQRELQEAKVKQGVKSHYNQAVQDFNENQSHIVDNPTIDPEVKQYLIERSQILRERVDHYKALKESLDIESSEEEYSSEDYSSEDSDSENTRPSKRPKND